MKNNVQKLLKIKTTRHRQYEAIRSVLVDNASVAFAARQFGYSTMTLYSLVRDYKAGKIIFFPKAKRGPKERQTPDKTQKLVIQYRKENLSIGDIKTHMAKQGYQSSTSTIARILKDAHFSKLPRRAASEREVTSKNQTISLRAQPLNFNELKPFRVDCPTAGVFFFLPYLIESGVMDILQHCKLPKSSAIGAQQACLSMLLLKLIGGARLSHMNDYDHERGLGVFAGLNFLPKATYMSTYSCRTSEALLLDLQQELMKQFQKIYPDLYSSQLINLDFHSIPHFGEQSQMEKVWCGSRSKAMKGANTLFAQDGQSNAILYTRADILHQNETTEILNFVRYWKNIRKTVNETLVFDCKLTTYGVLDQISKEKIKFITLRKRNQKLISTTKKIPDGEWEKVHLPIPKRKHKFCRIHVSEILLPKCTLPVRQIVVKDHGRAEPTYVITNDFDLNIKEVLMVYAKRWHIEQKFAELVSFFNLNALSSPLMIRIHFDILFTVIADTFYHRFAQDLPRFENERANSLSRHFIDMPGQLVYDRNEFIIKIRKRAHT